MSSATQRGSADTVPLSRVPLPGCGSISDSHSLTHSVESRRHAASEIHGCGRTRSHFRLRQLPESHGSVSHLVGSRELVSAKAVGFLYGTQNAAATSDGRGSLHSRCLVSDVRLEKCSGDRQ